jgi:putative sigma-54 modulation protein
MTLDDARHQLDVIDHDFYLFRDSETGELQVIYRRNHGGYGVIQAINGGGLTEHLQFAESTAPN